MVRRRRQDEAKEAKELWVSSSRGAVDETSRDQPIGVDLQDTVVAATGEGSVLVDE